MKNKSFFSLSIKTLFRYLNMSNNKKQAIMSLIKSTVYIGIKSEGNDLSTIGKLISISDKYYEVQLMWNENAKYSPFKKVTEKIFPLYLISNVAQIKCFIFACF